MDSVPGSSADERIALDASPSLPMCDICQARPCVIFCKEDRALLCAGCDAAMHSANKFVCMHTRFLLSGSRVAPGEPTQANGMQLAMPPRMNLETARGKRSAEQAQLPSRYGGIGAGTTTTSSAAAAAAAASSGFRGVMASTDMHQQQQQPAQPMAFVDGNPVAELLQIPNLGGEYGIKDVDDFGDFSTAEWEGLQSVLFEAPQSVPGSSMEYDDGKRAMGGSLLQGVEYNNDDSAVPDFGGGGGGASRPLMY